MQQLLRAGADLRIRVRRYGTAREVAASRGHDLVVKTIDAHIRCRLVSRLFDICCALQSRELPVLVTLECFDWAACECNVSSYADEIGIQLTPVLKWEIAKRVREQFTKTET